MWSWSLALGGGMAQGTNRSQTGRVMTSAGSSTARATSGKMNIFLEPDWHFEEDETTPSVA
jgi:hypothetical protein